MSDEKTYTEREMAHERQAVARTVLLAHTTMGYEKCDAIARQSFPLPKVTRPRVVQDPLYHWKKWRVIDGELQRNGSEDDSDEWVSTPLSDMTAARVRVLADLLANPTEEVDA